MKAQLLAPDGSPRPLPSAVTLKLTITGATTTALITPYMAALRCVVYAVSPDGRGGPLPDAAPASWSSRVSSGSRSGRVEAFPLRAACSIGKSTLRSLGLVCMRPDDLAPRVIRCAG